MKAQATLQFTKSADAIAPIAANDAVADQAGGTAIERLAPHLIGQITSSWGTWRLHRFLSRVTMMDRPERQGFHPDVANELFTLFLLNKELAGIPDYRDISL